LSLVENELIELKRRLGEFSWSTLRQITDKFKEQVSGLNARLKLLESVTGDLTKLHAELKASNLFESERHDYLSSTVATLLERIECLENSSKNHLSVKYSGGYMENKDTE
jgi:hypothetical protein